ncbi:MAG TPA: hypothetical protein VEV15_04305, partial [Flavisolibacter sp.]|nr:hypothetical protein [Flavisolibacter sp.]
MKARMTIALLSIILLAACEKQPLSPPVEKNHRIAIKLNDTYLAAEKIDSALLFWEINGKVQTQRLQLSHDTLFTETKHLDKGTGVLTVQLFTSIELRQRKLQWEKRTDLTLKDGQSIDWAAPLNFEDNNWFPRVIMIDAPTNFTAIVALRPDDAYFLLKNVPAGFKIELERHYVATPGGAVIVGGGLWKCNTVCT